jgi:hypothetical protein
MTIIAIIFVVIIITIAIRQGEEVHGELIQLAFRFICIFSECQLVPFADRVKFKYGA